MLHGAVAVDANWTNEHGTMKDSLKYIIRKAEGLRDGGYLVELLGAHQGMDQRVA